MKANHKKAIKITAIPAIPVLLVIAMFYIDRSYVKTGTVAICPKCLQRILIQEITICGWTHQSNKLEQRFDQKKISPKLYLEIMGKKCGHTFIKGGFGSSSGLGIFTGKAFVDGEYSQWSWYTPRTEAIEALYAAYVNTGNKELAQKTFSLIDAAFPIDDEKMKKACNLIKLVNEQQVTFENLPAFYIESAKIAKPMFDFEAIIPRLKEVQADEQWRQLLSELETGSADESNKR